MFHIGEVVEKLGINADTLRYYEKIKLLPLVARDGGGFRLYSDKDISRLKFIKRAKKMGFSLEEIGQLLTFRENPQQAKPQVKELAHEKLEAIRRHVEELVVLRDELSLLVNLCGASKTGCPILEELDGQPQLNEHSSETSDDKSKRHS